MAVCRLWYMAIESYPKLWTTFVIPAISPRFFILLLRRSKGAPLFVSFREPATGDSISRNRELLIHSLSVKMLRELLTEPERIEVLLMTFRSTVVYNSFAEQCWHLGPNLRSLSVAIEVFSHSSTSPPSNELWLRGGRLSGLLELRLSSREQPTSMDTIGCITSLVVLEILQVGVDMGQVLPCLAGLPSLQILRLQSLHSLLPLPDIDHSPTRALPTAKLRKLQMYYLSCHPHLCTQLTTHLRAPPSLRLTLDYHTWGENDRDWQDISSAQMVAPLLPLLRGYNCQDISLPVRALSLDHSPVPNVVMLSGWTQALPNQPNASLSRKPRFSVIQPDSRGGLSALVRELPLEDVEILVVGDLSRELHHHAIPACVEAWPTRMPRLLELRLTVPHRSIIQYRLILEVFRSWFSQPASIEAGTQTGMPWSSLRRIIIGGVRGSNGESDWFVRGLQEIVDLRAKAGHERQSKVLVRTVRGSPQLPLDDEGSLDSSKVLECRSCRLRV